MLEKWKNSIIIPNSKKGNKTECSNYRGMSLGLIMYPLFNKNQAAKIL
jgi:hypothetical protein